MMITRSKKTKTSVNINPQTSKEGYSFDGMPLDLVIEIIGRLPVKSIARFLLVSKLWARIIRSRDFIKSFPFGSSARPRLLVAFGGIDVPKVYYGRGTRKWNPRMENWYFFSSTLSSSSSFLSRSDVTCPLPHPACLEYHSHHVNGLISLGYGREQIIVNPTTGKSTILPRVKTWRKFVRSFFGYDPITDKYKVLCMTEKLHGHQKEASSHHQVFTLGAKKELWRMVECSIPHRPFSNGVCIDGVVYYLAKTGTGLSQCSLMRFDLRSEKLDLITGVSADIIFIARNDSYGLVFILNYEGKVAIPFQATSYTYDVWVMDQNAEKQEWLKKLSFSIEPWKSLFCIQHGNNFLRIGGVTQTGDFIFVSLNNATFEVVVFHYNHNTDSFRKIKVDVTANNAFTGPYPRRIVFADYVESVRFL